jgi:hypothetical protein
MIQFAQSTVITLIALASASLGCASTLILTQKTTVTRTLAGVGLFVTQITIVAILAKSLP